MPAPNTPQDLIDRIRKLERQVRQLSGRANIRPAQKVLSSGEVRIEGGGTLSVYPPGATAPTFSTGFASGEEYTTTLRRQTGEIALDLVNGDGASDSVQPIRLYDTKGNDIVADDIEHWGLARPWLPVPMAPRAEFTGSDWSTTHAGRWSAQNPVLSAVFSVFAPTGTTGEVRLVLTDGTTMTPVGSTYSASGGETFASFLVRPEEHGLAYLDTASLLIQGRRTAGTGTCTAWCQGFMAGQSGPGM